MILCGLTHWLAGQTLDIAVVSMSLPPKVLLRACVFLQLFTRATMSHKVNIKLKAGPLYLQYNEHHYQKWQDLYFKDRNLMVDVVRVDSQLSLDPEGLLFLGHGHGQAPGDLQRSIRLEGVEGGCCLAG